MVDGNICSGRLGRMYLFLVDNTKMHSVFTENKDKKERLLMKKDVFLRELKAIIFIFKLIFN
jgi:hypothetical protein